MAFALLNGGRLLASSRTGALVRSRVAGPSAALAASVASASARYLSSSRRMQVDQKDGKAASEPSSSSPGQSAPESSANSASSSSSSQPPEPTSSSTESSLPSQNPATGPIRLPSLDFTATANSLPAPSADGQSQETTGARSSKDSLSTIERKRRFLSRLGLALVASGLVGVWVNAGREWEEGEEIPQGGKEMGRMARANARLRGTTDVFDKPAWKELLPPPLPPPHNRPYTLLISMEDLMTASTWDREHGWRTMKRPGIEYFIGYLSQFYEIVVFTSQYAYSAIPVLEAVDPYQLYISYKLFRESTRHVDGHIVKDLSYLNRDLSKVIAIDTVPEHLGLNPDNAIIVPKWKGEKEIRAGLVNLIPFLESIAIHHPGDVRPILKAYAGKDVALEYGKFEADMKRKALEEWEKSGKKRSAVEGVSIGKLFGGAQPTMPTSTNGPPPTYLEQKRWEAQQNYRAELEYFKAQEATFKRLIEEDRERQQKEMSGSLFGMLSGQSGPLALLMGNYDPANPQGQHGEPAQGQQKKDEKDGPGSTVVEVKTVGK